MDNAAVTPEEQFTKLVELFVDIPGVSAPQGTPGTGKKFGPRR